MHINGWGSQRFDRKRTYERASKSLSKIEKMPRWMSQTLAVFILLTVGGLFLNGGALLAANFMHVLIDKVDMPPTMVYQTVPDPSSTGSNLTPQNHRIATPAKTIQKIPEYVMVPRPTLADAMDRLLIQLHNPADVSIQSDAVDTGLLLQQSLHQALASIFSDATRTRYSGPIPQGIPLPQGQ